MQFPNRTSLIPYGIFFVRKGTWLAAEGYAAAGGDETAAV
jgi:hypothetical protein